MMEDRDLVNMRESVDLEKIIAKYDKWSIAYNHFSEVKKYANKLMRLRIFAQFFEKMF